MECCHRIVQPFAGYFPLLLSDVVSSCFVLSTFLQRCMMHVFVGCLQWTRILACVTVLDVAELSCCAVGGSPFAAVVLSHPFWQNIRGIPQFPPFLLMINTPITCGSPQFTLRKSNINGNLTFATFMFLVKLPIWVLRISRLPRWRPVPFPSSPWDFSHLPGFGQVPTWRWISTPPEGLRARRWPPEAIWSGDGGPFQFSGRMMISYLVVS